MKSYPWYYILFLMTISLSACSATPEDITQDRRSRADLDRDPNISLKQFQIGDFSLRYAESGDIGKPTVVFIHGTPGSWRSLGRMMIRPELQESLRMVSIDRPGWGDSLLADKRSEPDFRAQSLLIAPLLEQLKQETNGEPLILAGHSYGGSISPYLAYAYPHLVNGVLMAASAIDPKLGRPRWYNWAASTWPISRLIDERLQIANDEIWGVAKALREIEDWWQTVEIPLTFVQGEEDELVHPRNLDFAETRFPPNNSRVVRLEEQGHLLHVQRRDLLSELTLDLITRSRAYLLLQEQSQEQLQEIVTNESAN
jgi:pimeloyl-ACP methyl ester carboxylesterase